MQPLDSNVADRLTNLGANAIIATSSVISKMNVPNPDGNRLEDQTPLPKQPELRLPAVHLLPVVDGTRMPWRNVLRSHLKKMIRRLFTPTHLYRETITGDQSRLIFSPCGYHELLDGLVLLFLLGSLIPQLTCPSYFYQ